MLTSENHRPELAVATKGIGETFLQIPSYIKPSACREGARLGPLHPGQEGEPMSFRVLRVAAKTTLTAASAMLAATLLFGTAATAQISVHGATQTVSTSSHDRWLHVRVSNPDSKEETVRVNVPLELAEKVLPTINKDRMHNGRVRIEDIDCHGVDLRALADAVRTSKDGEFVTVQNKDSDVRVSKQNGTLFVHVTQKNHPKHSQVEVKVPMRVVDALFSGGKDELDLVAALHALSSQGDTELVSVKDEENTVRIWLDSKNIAD
jgi:hypothetical protein